LGKVTYLNNEPDIEDLEVLGKRKDEQGERKQYAF
jgi:hypothetical protein